MERFLIAVIASWFLAACSAGPSESGAAAKAEAESAGRVTFTQGEQRVEISIGGEPFTAFHYEEKWDKPFLYPLRTASGTVISRGYPIEPRPGEHRDHDWHRGIWYGHGDINGHDFWRELGPGKSGKLVPVSAPVFESHGEEGALTAELALRTGEDKVIGTIEEQFVFQGEGSNRIIDVAITVRADKGTALTFGGTEDGGFAFRLADEFRQDRGAVLINSEGLRDTENIWGKPAKWVDYSAVMDGKPAGVAVFDHPSNVRHPTRWHARGYSLCAANPFGLGDFTGDESKDGSYTIEEGGVLTLLYRVVIHEGEMPAGRIEQLYGEFAEQ